MKLAWIESHQSLSRHRKTLKTAGRLSVDRHKLIGHLHELWWWAVDNVGVDGRLTGLTPYEIGLAAQWDGDPEEFVEALIDAGFIDRVGDELVLHDWYDYAGKLIEKRIQERERSKQRRREAKKKQDENQQNDQKTSNGRPLVDQEKTGGTVPNSTVPNSTNSSINNPAKRFDKHDPAMIIAQLLKDEILKQDPNTKVPKDLTAWAIEADRMFRLDKRDPAEAMVLIAWAQRNSFWRANILSMSKFRKQYDTLKRQAMAEGEKNSSQGNRRGIMIDLSPTKETAAERLLRQEIEREQMEADIIDVDWSEGG